MNILTGYLYSARLRVGFKFLRREPRGGRPVHRSGRRNLQVDQDLPKQTDSIKRCVPSHRTGHRTWFTWFQRRR